MRRVGFLLGALLLLVVAFAPAIAAQPFSDVPQDHWAYNAIDKLASAGLIEGYPNGTFGGKCNMSRYEFAVAITRLMDRVEQLGAGKGEKGEPGASGAPGASGGPGLTPEQQALLNRLTKEFAPELKALRSDLDALIKRVEELEARPAPTAPVVTVSGNIGWRTGVYGTGLGFQDVESTGYPAYEFGGVSSRLGAGTAFGVIPIDTDFGEIDIPISDALKDSFKAGDFMHMQTTVTLSANLSPSTNAMVKLLAGPHTNVPFPYFDGFGVSPNIFSGNGIMDVVQFDQMWVKHSGHFIAPVDLTIGKQYLKRGSGLLFDNDQEAIKALRADFGGDRLRIGTLLGMLDDEQFLGRTAPIPQGVDANGEALPTDGQDNINLFYLDWKFAGDWTLGGNYLNSGFNRENGYSVSLNGTLFGLGLYGEWSKLTDWPTGDDFADFDGDSIQTSDEASLSDSDSAWLAGLNYCNPWITLNGEYGQVDAGYSFALTDGGWDAFFGPGVFNLPLSALHPRAEVDPYYINWVDRPLFLDPTNIARGWHLQATFPTLLGESNSLTVSYATGDAYNPDYLAWLFNGGSTQDPVVVSPDRWRNADPVWWVKLSRQLSTAVSANLVYGHRAVDNVLSPQTVPVAFDEDQNPIFATNDAIQVIRAEVVVQF